MEMADNFLEEQRKKQQMAAIERASIQSDTLTKDQTSKAMEAALGVQKPLLGSEAPGNLSMQRQLVKELNDEQNKFALTRQIVADSPRETAQIIDQAPASDAVKSVVKNIAADPNMLRAKQEEIEEKKQSGKELGLVDSFVDSLQFFLPTAIGALVGGIVEGSEGALAGAEAAQKLGDAKREYDLKKQKFGQDSAEAENARRRLEQADRRLALQEEDLRAKMGENEARQSRFERNLELNLEKFGFSKEQAAQFSNEQAKEFGELTAVKDNLAALNPKGLDFSGWASGRLNSWASSIGFTPTKDMSFVEFESGLISAVSAFAKARSGTAVSQQEFDKLEKVLGRPSDSPQMLKTKIRRFNEEIDRIIRAKANTIIKGQSLKAETARKFLNEEPSPAPAAPKRVYTKKDYEEMQRQKKKRGW